MGSLSRNPQFAALYRAHRDAVWAYCIRRVPRHEVDDAVAEVFLVAWRRRDTAPDGDEIVPWLYGVARNVTRNAQRSSRRRTRLGIKVDGLGAVHGESAEAPVIRRATDEAILTAVAALEEDERELLRLRTWEELPIADIATVVGRSPRSVESKLARIRKKLAHSLDAPSSDGLSVRPRYAKEGGDR